MVIKKVKLIDNTLLLVRKPSEDDAEKMIEYLNSIGGETDNLLFGKGEFHLTIDQEKEYIINSNDNPNIFMVLGFIDDNIVSIAQISSSNRERIAHNCEVSISVKKEYWRKGIGSKVMEVLIENAKEKKKKNISLGVKASNEGAIRLYEKLGFLKVGYHKNYFFVDDKFDDEIIMDLYI